MIKFKPREYICYNLPGTDILKLDIYNCKTIKDIDKYKDYGVIAKFDYLAYDDANKKTYYIKAKTHKLYENSETDDPYRASYTTHCFPTKKDINGKRIQMHIEKVCVNFEGPLRQEILRKNWEEIMDKRMEDLKEKEIFNKKWIGNKRNTPKDQIIYDAYYLYSHRDWEY